LKGLRREVARDSDFLENNPLKILLSQNVNINQTSLGYYFFCMCPITVGKNIGLNYSPRTHTFCLSLGKGI
jgi:hypothetical protein